MLRDLQRPPRDVLTVVSIRRPRRDLTAVSAAIIAAARSRFEVARHHFERRREERQLLRWPGGLRPQLLPFTGMNDHRRRSSRIDPESAAAPVVCARSAGQGSPRDPVCCRARGRHALGGVAQAPLSVTRHTIATDIEPRSSYIPSRGSRDAEQDALGLRRPWTLAAPMQAAATRFPECAGRARVHDRAAVAHSRTTRSGGGIEQQACRPDPAWLLRGALPVGRRSAESMVPRC